MRLGKAAHRMTSKEPKPEKTSFIQNSLTSKMMFFTIELL